MSRKVSSPYGTTPTIVTDHRRPLNYLPYGIIRFRNEELLSSQVGEVKFQSNLYLIESYLILEYSVNFCLN